MSATAAMEVNAEARRILAVSISKLYASRTQRGGLRLHRSLLLSLVMRSARDIYHSSRESEGPTPGEPMDTSSNPEEQQARLPEPQPALISSEPPLEEPDCADEECETTEDKENMSPARQSRKRRGKASAAPDFLPSKRARLEPGEERELTYIGGSQDKGITGAMVRALRSAGLGKPPPYREQQEEQEKKKQVKGSQTAPESLRKNQKGN